MPAPPNFHGLYFVVDDMAKALAFYRDLGFDIPASADADMHVSVDAGSATFAFGTRRLTTSYNALWQERASGTPNALQFDVPSREAVDEVCARMAELGHRVTLQPFDAFWGSRYAEIEDPSGNIIGLHSPRDPSKAGRPNL